LHVLNKRFPDWREKKIHESSPHPILLKKFRNECKDYNVSTLFKGIALGTMHKGMRCENIEKQTFANEIFDLVITTDVLEHILNPSKAFSEIARTLKIGGAHVFTVPIYEQKRISEIRAKIVNGELKYLAKPEYHGNPFNKDGSLVTMHYGLDVGEIVLKASGMHTSIFNIQNKELGILGHMVDVLVSIKT
jgi:SAM-dependent methyltransferase